MAENGSMLLIYANVGSVDTPSYMKVGCQRDATIEESSDTIDVSCKDSRAQRVLPGRYSATVSLDTLYVPDDQAYLALKTANRNGHLVLLLREEDGVPVEEFTAKVDSLSESFPDQGEAVVSASFTVDGFPVAVGS